MGLREKVFEAMYFMDSNLIGSNEGGDPPTSDSNENSSSGEPWDPRKYHRAFVAGLFSMAGAFTSGAILGAYTKGSPWEAVISLVGGFFVGFAGQLAAEYGIRPKE